MFVLKVTDSDLTVKAYYVDSQSKDRHVHVVYTRDIELALDFDSVEEAAFHLLFISSNIAINDIAANNLCIAESQTYLKEL